MSLGNGKMVADLALKRVAKVKSKETNCRHQLACQNGQNARDHARGKYPEGSEDFDLFAYSCGTVRTVWPLRFPVSLKKIEKQAIKGRRDKMGKKEMGGCVTQSKQIPPPNVKSNKRE